MGVIRNKVAKVLSGALTGFNGEPVEVEADMKNGLPGLQIVGMGNKAIDEARQRVRSAISNSLLDFPAQKITVNLAPAELPKDGTHLDLPIALTILVASGQLKQHEVAGCLFGGELALTGALRPIRGAIILAELAHTQGAQRIYLPLENVAQAQLVKGIEVIGVSSLQEVFKLLKGIAAPPPNPATVVQLSQAATILPTIDAIVGQEQAKRALIIAAAGRHNVLLSGSPGAGKTLLAQALLSLLPPLTSDEIVEVTKLYSLSSDLEGALCTQPPFRAPHHSATLTALIGGGLKPRPGELSLAHKGVLFLDELPEYPRATLEALRQPLEDKTIHLSRLYGRISYPADALLVATMNPCPCGFLGDSATPCTCSSHQIQNYKQRISGPLLDRIDIRLTITKTHNEQLFNTNTLKEKQHSKVKKLMLTARQLQEKRYKRRGFYNTNATLNQAKQLFCVTTVAQKLLTTACSKLNLSTRSSLRVLRVARTIADLENSPELKDIHIAEALQYR